MMLRASCLFYSFTLIILVCSTADILAQQIYYTENGAVKRANLNGTGIQIVVPAGGNYIAYDADNDYLFYSNTQEIFRSAGDGTGAVQIGDFGAFAGYTNMDVFPGNEQIFYVGVPDDMDEVWAGSYYDAITDNQIKITPSGIPSTEYLDVAYNEFEDFIYYSDYNNGAIFQSNTSGSFWQAVVTAEAYGPIGIDYINNALYWVRVTGGINFEIRKLDLNTFASTVVKASSTNEIVSVDVYPKINAVFFAQPDGVFRMALDGTGLTQIISGSGISDIAVAPDVVYPYVTAFNPLDNATGFAVSANLNLTFNENVLLSTAVGTANETSVRIFKTTGNVLVETIDRSASNVVVSGTGVTIDPSADLEPLTDYYVLIGSKVLTDLSNNEYFGLGSPSSWNFRTDYDLSQYYSRQSGPYNDLNTWTNDPSHVGPPVSLVPGSGVDTYIGSGHTVTLTAFTSVEQNTSGLTINTGGTLDASSFTLDAFGSGIQIDGTLLNGGVLSGSFNLAASSGAPVFYEVNCGISGFPGANCNLSTDVIAVNGLHPIDGGILSTNGFNVCDGSMAPPTGYAFSNQKSTSVTLSWSLGAGDAFIVARQGSTGFKPNFKTLYNANAAFGSGDAVGTGNFVVYKGTSTSVTITGLSPNTYYEFDLYSYNTTVGGCYSVMNYQVSNFTTCTSMAAPTNPVGASYCVGDTKPAINVDSPGSGKNINWYDAAVGGNLVPGDVSGGDGRGGVFIPTAASGTFYAEVFDGTTFCTSDTRTAVTLTLNPVVTPGTATGAQTVCVGDDPTIILGGTATGGTGVYTYQWESSTVSTTGPYTDISGATLVDYDPPTGILLTTHFRRRVTSLTCTSQVGNFVSVTMGVPSNVTGLANTPGDAQITLNWTNPGSCFDEVLIIGKQGGVPLSVPVGDGTAYTASTVFGSGTAVAPDEFVVYKGIATSVTVTGLANSIAYSFKVFTRKGVTWSPGAITSGTGVPTPPVITFNPANGSTNILVTSNLIISFNEPVRNINNSMIDNTNLNSLLTFKLTNSAGADVPFTAIINGSKDIITIDPAATLLPSQVYFLNIAPVEDSNHNATTASSITFTTQAGPSITNVTPLSVCVGQNVTISGTNFGTAVPIVSVNSVNIPVATHTSTSISIVPSIAVSGVITVTNMDLLISTVSVSTLSVTALPTAFSVVGGGNYCVGGAGVTIGLANAQAGMEYEVYLGALATGVKVTASGGAFNFNQLFTTAGTYSVKGKNGGGCTTDMTGTAVVTVSDIPSGTGSITSSVSTICQGATVNLTAQGFMNAVTYVWTLPIGISTSSSLSGSAITVLADAPPGGLITVSARNNCGTSAPASTSITVSPSPVVSIEAPPDEKQIVNDVLLFTSQVDIPVSLYTWDFGDGGSAADANAEHTYVSEGQYLVSLMVRTTSGCEGRAGTSVSINQFPVISSSAIKNVVTANEDGKNDRLIIDNIERFPNNTVSVIDRWGVEVYKQETYNNDWNFKKEGNYLPAGSYVCIVKLVDSNTVITRTVTLIRK